MGTGCFQIERFADAETHFNAVIEGRTALNGAESSTLNLPLWMLARCLRKLERPAEAAVARRRAWRIGETQKGQNESWLKRGEILARDLVQAQAWTELKALIDELLSHELSSAASLAEVVAALQQMKAEHLN